jgi:RHS repeat-associated protein
VASSVYFHDKNNDGCITTEADTNDPDSLEVIQRFWYYPFGMAMQGLRDWATEPGQWYRYNGKERDTVSGWHEYGFRWYIDEIGRFAGVDPIADQFPWVSVFNYAENEPVGHIDLWGLQKTVYEMRQDQKFGSAEYKNKTSAQRLQEAGDEAKVISAGLTIATVGGMTLGAGGTALTWALGNPVTATQVVGTTGQMAVGALDEGNQVQLPGPWDDWGRAGGKLLRGATRGGVEAAEGAAKEGSKYLYHYTSKEAAQSISQQGLKVGRDGFSYLTNKGNLSPLQAQIELALPANRALPNSILRIDASGLSPSLIRRVSGNLPGYGAGGGTEFLFNQHIPANLIKVIK